MSEIKVVDDFDDATVKEPASSEAEQANRTVDNKDRLNINKEPPQSTAWEREAQVDKQQEQAKPKKEEEPTNKQYVRQDCRFRHKQYPVALPKKENCAVGVVYLKSDSYHLFPESRIFDRAFLGCHGSKAVM